MATIKKSKKTKPTRQLNNVQTMQLVAICKNLKMRLEQVNKDLDDIIQSVGNINIYDLNTEEYVEAKSKVLDNLYKLDQFHLSKCR